MNNFLKSTFFFLVILVIAGGCEELEEDTTGLIAPETFYNDVDELNLGVAAVYKPYMDFYLNAQGSLPTLAGDDVTAREDLNKGPYGSFDQFRPDAATIWLKDFSWTVLYRVIFHANAPINNYEKIEDSEERNQAIAQAFFLRGWAYFNLVRTFGPIPIVTGAPTREEPRSPEEDVYELIVSDLKFAVDNLPEDWGAEPGRVSQWAAKLYLAKVYVTMAGWPLKRTEMYEAAETLAKDVVDNSGNELLDTYDDLWNAANNNNDESILAIQACATCDGDWALNNRLGHSISPNDENSDNNWDDYFAEIAFFEEFPEGPRKESTFRTEWTVGGTLIDWTESFVGNPYYSKTTGGTVGGTNDWNWYVLRYAEALLLYAEAQNKADNGPNADAYEALNKVRRRAAGLDPNTPDPSVDLSGLSSEDFHDAVIAEAGWEFAAEWHRWFNLVRNEMVSEATAKRKADARELDLDGVSIGDPESEFVKFYYAPIPSTELIFRPDWDQNDCCR